MRMCQGNFLWSCRQSCSPATSSRLMYSARWLLT
jgi:hypothetical protein